MATKKVTTWSAVRPGTCPLQDCYDIFWRYMYQGGLLADALINQLALQTRDWVES